MCPLALPLKLSHCTLHSVVIRYNQGRAMGKFLPHWGQGPCLNSKILPFQSSHHFPEAHALPFVLILLAPHSSPCWLLRSRLQKKSLACGVVASLDCLEKSRDAVWVFCFLGKSPKVSRQVFCLVPFHGLCCPGSCT